MERHRSAGAEHRSGHDRAGGDPRGAPRRTRRDLDRAPGSGVVDDLQPNQQAWLRASEPVTLHENTAIIAVPNEFTRTQLEGRLRGQLEDALTEAVRPRDPARRHGQPAARGRRRPPTRLHRSSSTRRRVDIVDMSTNRRHAARRPASTRPAARRRRPSTAEHAAAPPALETRLNPKYTFETFVIGSSNRFPHAAAVAVAEAPGKAYNPLLVYGDSGLGKTHLLHAIGHYVRSLYTGAKVRYVVERGVHQRVHQRDPRRPAGPVQAALPRRRRAPHRRHPVPGGQDPDPGGVLPHLQHAPQRQQADRAHLRPGAQAARGARGPAAQPVRVGPDHRRPAARPRDPDRDPAQEGRDGPAHRAAGRPRVHRLQDPDQHPRARGCADPGHRVRQPQPPGGRHDPGRDRAQGPDPRGRRARDHRAADHRPDRGLLRRSPSRSSPARAAAGTW